MIYNIETNYNGFKISVRGEFEHGERPTHDYPGSPARFIICEKDDNIDITFLDTNEVEDKIEFWSMFDLPDFESHIIEENFQSY